jgi:type II secretory pathway component PulF
MKTKNISISSSEKLSLVSNLSTMISAGIPILSTIDSLLEESRGGTKTILETIHADLLQGKQLHLSLEKFPRIFNKVTVYMIKASEEAGTLDISLRDLKEQIKKDIEFNGKIRSAMTYPILVLFVFLAVLLLILVVVIPKIAQVFSQLKVVMPLPTRILIFASNLLLHDTLFVILGIVLICLGTFLLYRVKRSWFLYIAYRIPIISTLIKQIDLMRFSRSLYLLLTSGITITSALELTEEVVHKPEIAKAIFHAKETVLNGKTLSSSFKQNKKIFPGIMIKLTEAGEKTGTLDKSMRDISEHFDYEISNTLKTLIAVLEPVMLVVVGILVGGMMLSVIAPIYGLIGQINPR